MNLTTAEFKSRIEANGPAELATLFGESREQLKRMISYRLDTRLRGRIDASDVVQNTFLKACDELDAYMKQSEFSPTVWLRVLNKRSLAETHRLERAKRRMPDVNINVLSPSIFDSISDSRDSPSEFVATAELYEQVTKLFAGLSETDREVIVIHHIEQQTIEETAAELCISVGSAMKRYVRAIRKLKSLAQEQLSNA